MIKETNKTGGLQVDKDGSSEVYPAGSSDGSDIQEEADHTGA